MQLVLKLVPLDSVPGLVALWFLCTAAIAFITEGSIDDPLNAAAAVPFAILFYWASEPLEAIFGHWYGWSEREGTRLRKGKSALLPSGRDLDDARIAVIRVLPAADDARYPGEGVYERAFFIPR